VALAQAAVSRMRQLTLRVAQILDSGRPRPSGLWKAGVPMVMAVAALCAFSASQAPSLVGFADDPPAASPVLAQAGHPATAVPQADLPPSSLMKPVVSVPKAEAGVRAWPAALTANGNVPAISNHRSPLRARNNRRAGSPPDAKVATSHPERPALQLADYRASDTPEYLTVHEEVLVLMTTQRITPGGGESWQMQMWKVRVVTPATPRPKPVPRKT
jgi:hypothetical protein